MSGLGPRRRLLIVSGAGHEVVDGRVVSYAPEVRELDVVASLFDEVAVLAPPAAGESYPRASYSHPAIRLVCAPVGEASRLSAVAVKALAITFALAREARHGAVHVRSPGNLALVSLLALAVLRRPTFIKYRGAWEGFPGEPFSWRLERRLIDTAFRRSFVGVYPGSAPLPDRLTPMFASVMTEADLGTIEASARARRPGGARLLAVTSLLSGKRVDDLLEALALLPERFTLAVAGGGPERARLEQRGDELGLGDRLRFLGVLERRALWQQMAAADVYVHASRAEGYPKSCLEAMAHGLPCVVSDVPGSREILRGRGLTFALGDPAALADEVLRLTSDAAIYREMSDAGRSYAAGRTLEALAGQYETELAARQIA